MLLMAEKGIRGGIWNAADHYAKANNKYMDDYDKIKESSYLQYWDLNNLYGWTCPKSFQHTILNGLKILHNLTKF